jgi:regulatory protein
MFNPNKKPISLTPEEGLQRARNLCVKQEKSHQSIRNKLFDWQIPANKIESIIAQLVSENFLNEERFAQAYVRGKFNQKRWGRRKILQGLKIHKISSYSVTKAIQSISSEEYTKTIRTLILKKEALLNESNLFLKRKKIANYLLSKGYENDIIWDEIMFLIK